MPSSREGEAGELEQHAAAGADAAWAHGATVSTRRPLLLASADCAKSPKCTARDPRLFGPEPRPRQHAGGSLLGSDPFRHFPAGHLHHTPLHLKGLCWRSHEPQPGGDSPGAAETRRDAAASGLVESTPAKLESATALGIVDAMAIAGAAIYNHRARGLRASGA